MAKIPLVMPKMGESITEATITAWHKGPGDRVTKDEVVLEIATDKVDSEIPAPADGVLVSQLHAVDEVVAVGATIAEIETDVSAASIAVAAPLPAAAAASSAPSEIVETTKGTELVAVPASPGGNGNLQPAPVGAGAQAQALAAIPHRPPGSKRFYSPLVRAMAAREQVSVAELEALPGSGAQGRVTKRDLAAYLATRGGAAEDRRTAPAGEVRVATLSAALDFDPHEPYPLVYDEGRVERLKMSPMRRAIAEHMVRSTHIAPHVTSIAEADVTRIVAFRERHKAAFLAREGIKLSYTAFIAYATVLALREHPLVNVSIDGRTIVVHKDIHLGIATAVGSGRSANLMVPVIRNAESKNFVGIARAIDDLAARARQKQLSPDEAMGGTFTITNNGNFGVTLGLPVINQPQSAILGLGAIRKMPWVVEADGVDAIAIRSILVLSLAFDHRVIDGMTGGLALSAMVRHLQEMDFAALGV